MLRQAGSAEPALESFAKQHKVARWQRGRWAGSPPDTSTTLDRDLVKSGDGGWQRESQPQLPQSKEKQT